MKSEIIGLTLKVIKTMTVFKGWFSIRLLTRDKLYGYDEEVKPLLNIWAKGPEGSKQVGQSLIEHTYRVLLAFREILRKYKNTIDKEMEVELFWSIILHDLGKVATGFQQLLKDRSAPSWGHRHEVLSTVFMNWVLPETADSELWVRNAVLSHHKDPECFINLYPTTLQNTKYDAVSQLVSQVPSDLLKPIFIFLRGIAPKWQEQFGFGNTILSTCELNWLKEDYFYQWATNSIVRHLGEYRNFNKRLLNKRDPNLQLLRKKAILVRGIFQLADHRASANHFRFKSSPLKDTQTTLKSFLLDWPYEHQERSIKVTDSALLIAPTGSGKTETSFLWGALTHQSKKPSNVFYLLPYQASMNAMYQRLQNSFHGKVGILHSRDIFAHYREMVEQGFETIQATAIAKQLKSLTKLDQYPVLISSPYQILKAMFRLKGYEKLIFQLQSSAIIVDEIHAYDSQRVAMIIKMFAYLQKEWNVKLFIMSATLPKMLKQILSEEVNGCEEIPVSDQYGGQLERYRLNLVQGDLCNLGNYDFIYEHAKRNENVLFCLNKVKRAQFLYEILLQSGLDCHVELLHGRLHAKDRRSIETRLFHLFKKESKKPTFLVATQAVEVSLDLNFDVCYTDPAPVESLVQRFGRVNRKPFPPKNVKNVYVFTQEMGRSVYDQEIVDRTLEILSKHDGQTINESLINVWLDDLYSGSIKGKWLEKYEETANLFQRVCVNKMIPFSSDEQLEDQFYQNFNGASVLAKNLVEEYISTSEKSIISAEELLVPVDYHMYMRFKLNPATICPNPP